MTARTKVAKTGYHPYRVTILGIDTARISGWAIRVWGRLTDSGEVDTMRPQEVTDVLLMAADRSARSATPLLLVLERPWGGSVVVVDALGRARERWLWESRRLKLVPERRVFTVTPNTWRSAVFGSRWVRVGRDEIRAHELATARVMARGVDDLGPDEAAAICISQWGAYAHAVGERLGIKGEARP